MSQPLCFVLVPFGENPDASGLKINFDAVYRDLIAPAIKEADLEPIRADEEMTGGTIHKPMFEQLVLCDYAVADLTTANADVFYQLGVRHAVRPGTTVLVFPEGSRLTFDVTSLRALPYALTSDGLPKDSRAKSALATRLKEARNAVPDSLIYQLVEDYSDISHTKTDVFRERVRYSAEKRAQLAEARKRGPAALRATEKELGNIEDCESGVVIDLLLSYRSVRAWKDMIDLVKKMSRPLASTVMVQEQLALALNREGKGEEAEQVLKQVLDKRGPSSETYSILGRVYKDRWEEALKRDDKFLARGLLEKAIEAYLRGFEADWRDAYPGINAVTLMELNDPPDPRRRELISIVAYAVERRIASGKADYWDHATRIELAVLAKSEEKALTALGDALAAVRESWEPETTARNLRLIREARERRNERVPWAQQVEAALEQTGRKSGGT